MIHQVSNLRVFKKILDDKNALAKVNSSKDLLAFINYILRKFFKEAQAKPMLLVEAFFPLNKSSWKEHSTYHSDEDSAQEEDLARIRANRVSRRCECRFGTEVLISLCSWRPRSLPNSSSSRTANYHGANRWASLSDVYWTMARCI
jgi:hypothetical protein